MNNNVKTISIFYFSGTGNTWYVSKKLVEYLDKHFKVSMYSVETLSSDEGNNIVDNSDIVVFGYPIYASYVPSPMIKFMKELKTQKNKLTGIFCTQMMFSGDGARIGDSFIVDSGFKTKWGIHINMPNNLNCGAFSFLPITNDEKKLMLKRKKANVKIKKFAECIINNKEYKQGFSKGSKLLAKMQRPNDKKDINRLWKNCMSIDKNSCVKCGKCLKLCPSNNIFCDESGYYISGNCSGCLRCHNFCSSHAIMFKGIKCKKECYHGPIKGFNPFVLKKKN